MCSLYYFFFSVNVIYYRIGKNPKSFQFEHAISLLLINDKVTTYDMISEAIWNNQEVSDGTRRQLIHRLKAKLKGIELGSKKGEGIYLKR